MVATRSVATRSVETPPTRFVLTAGPAAAPSTVPSTTPSSDVLVPVTLPLPPPPPQLTYYSPPPRLPNPANARGIGNRGPRQVTLGSSTSDYRVHLGWQGSGSVPPVVPRAWSLGDECHQQLYRRFECLEHCILCFVQSSGQERASHANVAGVLVPCPHHTITPTFWLAFRRGWSGSQWGVVEHYRTEMSDKSGYHYCARCGVEKCSLFAHQGSCHYYEHDEELCKLRQDHNPDWLIQFAFLILRQDPLRMEIARELKTGGTDWSAQEWGSWAVQPYQNNLSNATLIVVYYLMYHLGD